jgi:hypothetical protein
MEWLVHRVEHFGFRFWQIAGKIVQERGLGQAPLVAVEDNASRGGRCRKLLGEGGVVLTGIRRPRRDINHRRDFWIDAGFGNDHARE